MNFFGGMNSSHISYQLIILQPDAVVRTCRYFCMFAIARSIGKRLLKGKESSYLAVNVLYEHNRSNFGLKYG